MLQVIKKNLNEAADKLQQFIEDENNLKNIESAAILIAEALSKGKKVISCGNGGSLCDATHFAEELTGRYKKDRIPLPAICINDPAYFTCVGNDFSFDIIFSRFLEALGQEGDILLVISTSGNSPNIIKAVESAHIKGMKVVALTCDSENRLRVISDIAICVPKSEYSDRIQEIHIKVIHILVQLIEEQCLK